MRDVAAYAVAALDHRHTEGRTLIIGGPQPLAWRDIVEAFEQQLGRHLALNTVPPGQPVPGLPDFITELLAVLDTYDSPIDITELASTYGVTPTPVADFIRDFLAANRQPVG
jgi:NADH dehydrogenase